MAGRSFGPQATPRPPLQTQPDVPTAMDVLKQGGSYTSGYENTGPLDPRASTVASYYIPPAGAVQGLQAAAPARQPGSSGGPPLPNSGLPMGGQPFNPYANPAATSGRQPGSTGGPTLSSPPPPPPISGLNPAMFSVNATALPPISVPDVPGFNPASAAPQLQPVDTSASTSAAFARAKDQVGLESRGALTGLAGAMAGRGTVGSGVEGRGMTSVINKGLGELGDVSRGQAITAADLANQNAVTSYQGGITQRGQDLAAAGTARGQDITQRGQDINTLEAQRTELLNTQSANAQRALDALMAQYNGKMRVAGY